MVSALILPPGKSQWFENKWDIGIYFLISEHQKEERQMLNRWCLL